MDGTSRHAGPRTGRAAVAATALLLGLLAGCGSGGGDAAQPGDDLGYGAQPSAATDRATSGPGTQELVIVVEDFAYTLPDAVPAGAEVVVRNLDGVGHTVTADEGDAFDVVVGPGEEARLTVPSEPGEYPFHCTPHPAMTGTLVVEGAGS